MERQEFKVLPPAPGHCPICAVKHAEELPHDATSFYYRTIFSGQWNRLPTWGDAPSHCSPEMQEEKRIVLKQMGIDPNSQDLRGAIKTQADLDARLKKLKE